MPNAGRSGRVYTDLADDELYAAICGSDLARLGVNRDATLRPKESEGEKLRR